MGIQLQKLCRSRIVVVFGGMSRIGRATIEVLTGSKHSVVIVAAVENARGMRARQLKRESSCFLVQFDPLKPETLRRAIKHADVVLLIPTLAPGGAQFAKILVDAVASEQVPAGLVLISSVLAASGLTGSGEGCHPDCDADAFEAIEAHARTRLGVGVSEASPQNTRCVSLRVPLLMETILYCRDEIIFANRIVGCFAPTTWVPCISVRDVAIAASCALVRLMNQHDKTSSLPALEPIYALTNAVSASISPLELSRRLSALLSRPIKYCQLPDEAFISRMKEKGAPEQVAKSMVAMKKLLEATSSSRSVADELEPKPSAGTGEDSGERSDMPPQTASSDTTMRGDTTGETSVMANNGLHSLRSTNDFQRLTKDELLAPVKWLEANRSLFERTPQNQIQLFVVGAGDAIFVEIGQFVANQITDPLTTPPPDAGEGALPTIDTIGNSRHHQPPQQAKVTLCTIKSPPMPLPASQPSQGQTTEGQSQSSRYYQVKGSRASPVAHLLDQLTALDVVLFAPPLRLGAAACMEIVKTIAAAAARANAWGIVVVSSIFAGAHRGAGHRELQQLDAIEQVIKNSGVAYVIVRLPLLMEYLLALSGNEAKPMPPRYAATEMPASKRDVDSCGEMKNDEGREQGADSPHFQRQEGAAVLGMHPSPEMASMYCGRSIEAHSRPTGAQPSMRDEAELREQKYPAGHAEQSGEGWPLLSYNLASSPLYWMTVTDAAKALVSIAFTFPLHRNRTRTLFTEAHTLEEVAELARSAVAQRKRSHSITTVDLSQVDALRESPGREFWKVAFWPRRLTECFLECAVEMSVTGNSGGLHASESYELVTDCPPVSMERWMQSHAKSLSLVLAPRTSSPTA